MMSLWGMCPRGVVREYDPPSWYYGTQTAQSSTAELKRRLLKSVAGVNRGLSCREAELRDILALVEQLEVRDSRHDIKSPT